MSRLSVVTGAASGIGKAVADAFREGGDEVLGLDRTAGDGIAMLDLASPDAGEEVLALLAGRDADVLVNVAAVFHSGDLEHTRGQDWDRLYAVNLRAPYLLSRALAPGLARTKGTIVNVSSVNAIRNAPANIAYDSLKAGLDHMTRGLALELWRRGVRVNAVAPGGTATQGLKDWMVQASHLPNPPHADSIEGHVERGNFALPDDIARIVIFLASKDARWINGAIILADNAVHIRGAG